MKLIRFPIWMICAVIVTAMFSCVETAPTREVRLIDSLNQVAYQYRYRDLDSSFHAASMAYNEANIYKSGKAEACNNLGFCAFMHMNFDRAEELYREVYDLTRNELELLIADIGLMKIYQRTAMFKAYYDSRNSAIRRMRRIDEDRNLFVDKHENSRLNYAYTEFFIVSAVYYYYLEQKPEALAMIEGIRPEELQSADTSQLLYHHYIKGASSLTRGDSHEQIILNEFDELYRTWKIAQNDGYVYFEGNSLQGMANLLIPSDNLIFLTERRSHALHQLCVPVDESLPLNLARIALEKFKEYNDMYQIAGAYVSIGRYLNSQGEYSQAIDSLTNALNYVNLHHRLYYTSVHDTLDVLQPYVDRDTVYTEVSWMKKFLIETVEADDVKTVPEWISRIREQLSVSYAGLNMKAASDYNRNIYLYILDYTRQDKELETRLDIIKVESRQLNILLLSVILGIILMYVLFWFVNKRSKKRSQHDIERLQRVLDICRKITGSIPADVGSEDEIIDTITQSIASDIREVFGITNFRIVYYTEEDTVEHIEPEGTTSSYYLSVPDREEPIGVLEISTPAKLSKDEQVLMRVIAPYIAWTLDNGKTFVSLGDERNRLDKERYVYEKHIIHNKRENLIKKACFAIVAGINPYIDRIVNEVHKLTDKQYAKTPSIKHEKYQYIDELVTRINEYNNILALWIKMKQGSLNLSIENFELNDLFSLVAKGKRTFEMKHQQFDVEPTSAVVKADKALTLFMINTLTENARKYTPEGGSIRLNARQEDYYVEISVSDNGRGLSREDIDRIVDEKIYDSRMIGIHDANDPEELSRLKGSGFGLMNCKGIIEKYRKTNKIFDVCTFSVESELGKGSRFYFRLPVGIKKTLNIFLGIIMSTTLFSCGNPLTEDVHGVVNDSIEIVHQQTYEILLEEAVLLADTVYYCNLIEDYDLALKYVDLAIEKFNRHYQLYSPYPVKYMSLRGPEPPAEVDWLYSSFKTYYDIILYIRNEAAISYLGLKDWKGYDYNNTAYRRLFKLYSESELEEYYRQLERSSSNKMVGLILLGVLVLSSLVGYYLLYVRKRIMNRLNLEQVLDINQKVFSSSLIRSEESMEALEREEEALKDIPQRIVNESFESINELIAIDNLVLAVFNQSSNKLEYASTTDTDEFPEMISESFNQQNFILLGDKVAIPLFVEAGYVKQTIGVIYLEKREGTGQESDRLLLELVARYIAVVVYNAVIRVAIKYRDIESAYEETHRASWEDSLIHVQNMVLDNCLSTIKHETVYYPNKIKQIVDKLINRDLQVIEEKDHVEAIKELIEYYKGIFTILSSCAGRQLEEVTFRRSIIPVKTLTDYADKYFRKRTRNMGVDLFLSVESIDESVLGDITQLYFLIENLIDEALSVSESGRLEFNSRIDGDYIRFMFTDSRREKSVGELNQLFYPSLKRMRVDENREVLTGTEYLVCKQIIREHDEYAGRRGCRINAEPAIEGGFTVFFTIPKR